MAFSCFPQSPPVWSLQAQEALFPLPFAISHSWEGLAEPALFENSQSAQISLLQTITLVSVGGGELRREQQRGDEGWRAEELLMVTGHIALIQKNTKI